MFPVFTGEWPAVNALVVGTYSSIQGHVQLAYLDLEIEMEKIFSVGLLPSQIAAATQRRFHPSINPKIIIS